MSWWFMDARASSSSTRRRALWTGGRVAIACALLAYLSRSGALNVRSLAALAANWPVAVAALGVLVADLCVTAWRLCLLLRVAGLRLGLRASIHLTLIGTFFSICLPGSSGGDIVRVYYATLAGDGQRTEVFTLMILDRVLGLFALLLLPLMVAPFFASLVAGSAVLSTLLWTAGAGVLAMVGAAVALSRPALSRGLAAGLRKVPFVRLTTAALDTVAATMRARGTLASVIAVSLLGHTLSMAVLVLVARALDPSRWALEIGVLAAFGFVANSLPLTPGGLGVGEAAFDRLFALAGASGGAEVVLGWRVLMAVLGVIGFALYVHGRARIQYGRRAVAPRAPLSSPDLVS